MDTHPVMRIQFFLRGPFDQMETLSVTFLDDQWNEIESVALGGEWAQYKLWELISKVASDFMAIYGTPLRLDLENDKTPGH